MAEKKSSTSKRSIENATPPSSSKGKAAKAQSQRNLLLIGGAAAVGIVVFLLLWRGKPADTMAVFMPANTALYVHLDLNELTSAEMEEITAAFQAATGEEVVEDQPDAIQQEVETALGLDYEEYISSWLGTQLGAGFLDLNSSDPLSGNLDGTYVVVIESRDPAAADAFLDELAASAEEDGHTVISSDYQGVRIIEMGADFALPAAAQGKGVVILADSAATIQASLDLKAGDSLSSVKNFTDSVGDLSGGRLATAYVNLSETMQADGGVSPGLSPAYQAMLESSSFALGASVVPAGIQIEFVFNVDEAKVPAAAIAALKAATEPITMIERYPEGTILFAGTRTNGLSPEALRETMGEEAFLDYQESIDSLSTSIGIDINNLLIAFDGEFSLGLFPQEGGIGTFTGGYGLQLMLTTSHDAELATFLADLAPVLVQSGIAAEPRTIASMASYVASDPLSGVEVLAFGSGSGLGFLTTDVSIIDASLSASFVSFTDSEAFQKVKTAVGPNGHPVFYLDLAGLISLTESTGLSSPDSVSAIRPLTAVAAAIEPYQGGALRGVVIFFIDR